MSGAKVEYVGFAPSVAAREYHLRVRMGAEAHDFTVAVPNEAFLSHRVRYQDAAEVCFIKLQRALEASGDMLPERALSITDAELEEYRVSRAPKSPRRRS